MDEKKAWEMQEDPVRVITRLREELKDWEDSAQRARDESVTDEKHCACVPLLLKNLKDAEDRARTAAQTLIETIGASGPEDVDETATRAVNVIVTAEARVVELEGTIEDRKHLIFSVDDLRAALDAAKEPEDDRPERQQFP
jgi:hypothetical protein